MHASIRLFAILALALSCASALAATEQYDRNWPQWRGPAANGLVLHGNPPLHWAEDKNIKWKVAIPGLGHATPIIWENKIFILTAVPAAGGDKRLAFTVLCLDRQTGKTLWSKIAPRGRAPSGDSAHQQPQLRLARDRRRAPDRLVRLVWPVLLRPGWEADLGEGPRQSQGHVGRRFLARARRATRSSSSRTTKKLLSSMPSTRRTGKELWKKPRDEKSSWTTPFVLTRDGKTQVIINGSTAVRSYDPATGDVLWQCSGLGVNVTPMVVVDQNTVYAMSGQRTSPMAMAIQLGRSGDLTDTDAVLWKLNRGTPYAASPLLYDGLLYFFQHVTPILTCLDAATGQPHYAQQRLEGLTTVYASPIGVNNRVYVTGLDGTTLVLEKSKELKILATQQTRRLLRRLARRRRQRAIPPRPQLTSTASQKSEHKLANSFPGSAWERTTPWLRLVHIIANPSASAKTPPLSDRILNNLPLNSGQPMLAACNAQKLMLDLVLLELRRHQRRLLVRHIGVLVAVNQQRRRILGRDVLHRHEGCELLRLGMRIPARHGLGPRARLAAELIERAAVALAVARVGDGTPATCSIGLVARQLRLCDAADADSARCTTRRPGRHSPTTTPARRPRLDAKARDVSVR